MSLPRPDVQITLDGTTLHSHEAGLASLRLDLGFNGHDRLRLAVWRESKLASAAPGQALSVMLSTEQAQAGLAGALSGALGAGGTDANWTGEVESVATTAGELHIDGLASTAVLSRTRRSSTWTEQSVADIVADLAGELDNEIDADLPLSSFSIDNRRTVWAHLCELARLSGAELSCAPGGGVRFILATQETAPVVLRYGAELVDWRLCRRRTPVAVAAAEHGAASAAGADKWHWLAHDPVGSSTAAVTTPGALRTRDAAEQFSSALEARAARAGLRGSAWLGGRPDLRPGMLVTLSGIPEGDSESLRIKAVTHSFDSVGGFVTALALEGAGGGAAGGLL